jgi:DNA-binding NarL/FixJ family response regulator
MTTRVLIVDDHTMVREALRWACEHADLVVVGEAGNGQEAVAQVDELLPDVVLMDLSLPVMSGVAATKRIRAAHPETSVLILSMLSDESAVSSALAAGAGGFMVKDRTTAEIVAAVHRVQRGEVVLSPGLAMPPPEGAQPSRVGALAPEGARALVSKREEEVLRLVATGVSIPQAASELYISVKTVKNHLSSIYQKLDSHDRAQAVVKAMRMGIIQLD